ncbi:MAG: cobalamin biosynthesis protein CbiD, partial [Candidatus Omnitrophica bacterium]|nr:cobalamin biosynthesis protein CbiD [Candidatus Omnitrophota bacterium]
AVAVNEWAINPVPCRMILKCLNEVLPSDKGFVVEISAPEGERIAKKTYNPRLGIEGGISIIGTTGVVKPKSQESYKKSLMVELNVACAAGFSTIFIASGYLGERLLTQQFLIPEQQIIKAGDHIGFMIEQCVNKGVGKAMIIGHIGKLAKVAAGLFNTHSQTGDARLETIAAYAAAKGANQDLVKQILDLKLAEAAIDLLGKNGLMPVFDDIAYKVVERSQQFCEKRLELTAIILSLKGEVIGKYPQDILEARTWEKFIS